MMVKKQIKLRGVQDEGVGAGEIMGSLPLERPKRKMCNANVIMIKIEEKEGRMRE
jgi:hypothetical protein